MVPAGLNTVRFVLTMRLILSLGLATLAVSAQTISPRAVRLHRDALVFDAHVHMVNRQFYNGGDIGKRVTDGQVDLPRMREGGVPLEAAIREAARVRLRPILMTTLCTLFGLLPLALGLGAGSELQRPLALAVIGGLALSTPITLYVVPTLLVAIRGRDYTTT